MEKAAPTIVKRYNPIPDIKADNAGRLIAGGNKAPEASWIAVRQAKGEIGVGASPSDASVQQQYMFSTLNETLNCGFSQVPVMEYVTWTIELPQLDTNLTSTFGESIQLFQNGPSVPGVTAVDSSFVQNGTLQVDMLVCGFGIHIFGEPDQGSVMGNFVYPTPTAGAVSVSPDALTVNDVTNYALGPAIATGTQQIIPAILEFGAPVQQAMWHLANGYQAVWKYQQRNLLVNELVADVAYYGSYAEATAAGDSQQAAQRIVRRVNDHYQTALGTPGAFIPINAQRVGSYGTGGSAAGTSATGNRGIFHPTRAYDLMDTCWGGLQVQGRVCNNPFRKLPKPVILEKGVAIGIQLFNQDPYHVAEFLKYMSITDNGQSSLGASYPADIAFSAGSGGTTVANTDTFLELEFSAGLTVPQQVITDRVLYKGGALQIMFGIKGIELWGPWKGFIAQHAKHLVDCSCCGG
jgi:hypothetical protein